MKQSEEIQQIQLTNPVEWSLLYNKTFDELSEQQPLFCCCGKLATGLHEMYCHKFADKVRKETLKRWKIKKAGTL